MIPKIIHYCWISDESNMSQKIKDCIESWHKYMPEYRFINWNDKNFDWNICEFTKYCRKNDLYAFCADYIRFWSIYNYGGIYLDSDVLVHKSFDELLNMERIITMENTIFKDRIECAIIGGNKSDILFKQLLDFYNKSNFRPLDTWCCICPDIVNYVLEKNNYHRNNILNINDEIKNQNIINILDNKYFNDFNNHNVNEIATHLFNSAWCNNKYKFISPQDIDKYIQYID